MNRTGAGIEEILRGHFLYKNALPRFRMAAI